jgi:hypothetical protein
MAFSREKYLNQRKWDSFHSLMNINLKSFLMHPHIQLKNQKTVFRKGIYILFFSSMHIFVHGQCINTSNLSGSTFTNDNTISGTAFSSLANVGADDASSATASITLSLLGSGKTNYLKATGFGFAIPASATICGISVSIKKRATGINILNSISDEAVRLVVAGTATGTNKAKSASWTGTAAFSNYGGAADTWSTTLTPAEVNSSNFGVAIAADYSGLAGVLLTAEIDYITMQVSYMNIPVPLILGEFTTNISGNLVENKWIMYEEEENAKINLQRSIDAKVWDNIKTVSVNYFVGERSYEILDKLEHTGVYYYRLELIHATGNITYSKINMVNYKPDTKISAYPNPATSFMYISNVSNKEGFALYTLLGEKISTPYTYLNGLLQLNLKGLKTGTYFLATAGKRLSIIKQ